MWCSSCCVRGYPERSDLRLEKCSRTAEGLGSLTGKVGQDPSRPSWIGYLHPQLILIVTQQESVTFRKHRVGYTHSYKPDWATLLEFEWAASGQGDTLSATCAEWNFMMPNFLAASSFFPHNAAFRWDGKNFSRSSRKSKVATIMETNLLKCF